MEFYGLVKEFRRAGYYETDHLHQLFKEIKAAIHSGKLIALSGVVGCGYDWGSVSSPPTLRRTHPDGEEGLGPLNRMGDAQKPSL